MVAGAADGPLLVMVVLKVSVMPAVTGLGEAVMTTLRSAEPDTAVVPSARLLPMLLSNVSLITRALWFSVPVVSPSTWTTMVTVIVPPPAAREPKAHVVGRSGLPGVPAMQLPVLGVTETR